jgi:hypothetical protein
MTEKWTTDALLVAFIKGVDERKLKAGDEKEEAKFRRNAARLARKILKEPPEVRARALSAIKQGYLKMIEGILVITPTITAVIQTLSGEDLGTKIDTLGTKMDRMIGLQEEMIELQREGQKELGAKIDNLGKELSSVLHEILRELRVRNMITAPDSKH